MWLTKRNKLLFILIGLIIISFNADIVSAKPDITARSAIVVDVKTGEVLYAKNHHERRPPASTTKIMTGILAIENGNLDTEVTVSDRAAYTGGSSIWLTSGETLKLEELLYGLLLNSGNDAAVAIAEHIGGSVEGFAWMMNRKAREIGALNTTFQNPNGLPQNGHLTTAYDLALITRYALQNDTFAKIVRTVRKTISWEGHEYGRSLLNTNRLLRKFDKVDGVKTGYTDAAGRCLVSAASADNRQVVSVVLKSGQMWHDSIKLLNYGLDNFKQIELISKDETAHTIRINEAKKEEVDLIAAKEFGIVIPQDEDVEIKKEVRVQNDLKLPIEKGEQVGKLTFYVAGEKKGIVPLLTKRRVTADSKINNFFQKLTASLLEMTSNFL
ncbi:D-alanyl-D-alanine carboxypeptidase family protein [Acetohalobium arabaticum]|uniref:serine-type D-Ala-D-Ala carboxypeptidase n=1 Tax=Acetohalobium arabaticum (strain ATCC 49924 / DSM 5501 / Z-7288) TaxID=574087 RepID=D9QRP1_ACEAZ|nr:D-alanyl-D-alanine carboxypeptidase family protein [Acetohalobium arabaticum]ADL13182.1 Serine-type D-Ala-D-Ala carboxypeptidase [Acetohalobium arabaticum DSM 5501]